MADPKIGNVNAAALPKSVSMMGQKKCYLVTQMNGVEAIEENLRAIDKLTRNGQLEYAICGVEVCPSTGLEHMHGFLMFKNKKSASSLYKLLATPSIDVKTGKDENSSKWREMNVNDMKRCNEYCQKDDDVRIRYGELKVPQPGRRTDKLSLVEDIRNNKIKDLEDALILHPSFTIQHMSNVERAIDMLKPQVQRDISGWNLRKWQKELVDILSEEPDDRTILFVVDEVGNSGKTKLGQFLPQLLPSKQIQKINPGKRDNLTWKVKEDKDIYVFDIARFRAKAKDNGEVFLHYDVLENLKDGEIDSDKYQSRRKALKPCHVVVFMNHMPDMDALSADRYVIMQLIPSDNEPYEVPAPLNFGAEFSSDMTGDGPVYYRGHVSQQSMKKRFRPCVELVPPLCIKKVKGEKVPPLVKSVVEEEKPKSYRSIPVETWKVPNDYPSYSHYVNDVHMKYYVELHKTRLNRVWDEFKKVLVMKQV